MERRYPDSVIGIVLACFLAGGCGGTAEVVIGIVTDLAVGADLDSLRIQTFTADSDHPTPTALGDDSVPLTEATSLPGTYTVTAERDAWVRVQVIAMNGRLSVVERDAVLPLNTHLAPQFYRLALVRSCAGMNATCANDQTCIEGACASPEVTVNSLVAYRPELVAVVDCTVDGAPPFTNTATGDPLSARGACPDGTRCQEGSCRAP